MLELTNNETFRLKTACFIKEKSNKSYVHSHRQHLSALLCKRYRNKVKSSRGGQLAKDNMQNTQKAEVIFTVPASRVFLEGFASF